MKSKLLFVLLAVFVITFIVGLCFLICRFADIVAVRHESESTEETETATESVPTTAEATAPIYPYANSSTIDETAYDDMIAWLTVPNTSIDYPVMQRLNRPDYYLTRDYTGKASPYGCPYLMASCNLYKPSDNLIIYGRDMPDGTMFAPLNQYKDYEYFKKHKTVTLRYDGKKQDYSVLAFIVLKKTEDDDKSFKFYEFVDAYDPKSFNDFVKKCKSLSLYDTGVTAKHGDELLTLATTEYNEKDERLLLIAKRK